MSWRILAVEQQTDGRIFVVVYSRATDRRWLIDGLPEVVAAGSDAQELGAAVMRGLQRSTEGQLQRRNLPDAEFLTWVGATDYADYSRGVRSVNVFADFDDAVTTVEVTPQARHHGGGYTPIPGTTKIVTVDGDAALGDAVLQAFSQATV